MFKFLKKLLGTSSGHSDNANESVSDAVRLMREAAQLKERKQYDAASDKLAEALQADGADLLDLGDQLRLPFYLQLAGRSEEGWKVLNELNTHYSSLDAQALIADKMRNFLLKDKNYPDALMFTVWWICAVAQRDQRVVQQCIRDADNAYAGKGKSVKGRSRHYGETERGNPILDPAYKIHSERLAEVMNIRGLSGLLRSLHKKSGRPENVAELAGELVSYLQSKRQYDIREVNELFLALDRAAAEYKPK